MIAASDIKERITIQQPVVSDDGYGGKVVSWSDMVSVFAQVKPIQGAVTERERFIAEQRNAYAGYRVAIRLRTDVTAAMRIVWKTHTLLIHSLHENDAVLNMLCYEENL